MNARHLMKLVGLPKSTKRELVRQFQAISTLANELKLDHNAALAKLDLDAGVTDTNYVGLTGTAAADIALI